MTPYSDIASNALWRNNAGFVQLLGLCPLLAVTTTLVDGLGLGIATTVVLLLSNVIASLLRPLLRPETRIAIFLVVIASLVTVVDLYMRARFFDLHRSLGIFVPLIATNCAILARAEVFASKHDPLRAAADGLLTGIGFAAALIAVGAIREVAGQGTLFAGADRLFGSAAGSLGLRVFDGGFLVAALPAGAFLTVGLLIALQNALGARKAPITVAGPAES